VPAAGLGLGALHDAGEGVDRLAVDQHVHLHQLALAVRRILVVHAAVAAGDALDAVVEVHENLRERDVTVEHHAPGVDALGVLAEPALFHDQGQDVADVLVGDHDEGLHHGLLHLLDDRGVGQVQRIVQLEDLPVGARHAIDHARVGGDDVHVELPAQALLDDLHVQQAQETAAEAEAQRDGALLGEGQRRVVELELGHRVLQRLELGGVDGIDAGEHHRGDVLEAGQRLGRAVLAAGNGVAHLHVAGGLDVGDEIAHVARVQVVAADLLGREDAHFLHLIALAGGHEHDRAAGLKLAGEITHVSDDAAIGIKDGIKDQAAQVVVVEFLRRRNATDDRLKDFVDADALLGAGQDGLLGGDREHVLKLTHHLIRVRAGQVDLVDDRDERQALTVGQVHIGHGLGLDALSRVDDQQRAVARREAA